MTRLSTNFAALKTAALALLIAGCVSATPSKPMTILPGVLDLAVVSSSRLLDRCPDWVGTTQPAHTQLSCVMIEFSPETAAKIREEFSRNEFKTAISATQPFQNAYVKALRDSGWNMSAGAANVFQFERPSGQAGCVQRMFFAGVYEEDPRSARAVEPGQPPRRYPNDPAAPTIYLFAFEPALKCTSMTGAPKS
jgi:hypothetical protein